MKAKEIILYTDEQIREMLSEQWVQAEVIRATGLNQGNLSRIAGGKNINNSTRRLLIMYFNGIMIHI